MFIAPICGKLSPTGFVKFFQKVDPYMKLWAMFLVLAQILLCLLLIILQARTWMQPQGMLTIAAFACGVISLGTQIRGVVGVVGFIALLVAAMLHVAQHAVMHHF